jgi:hypothetical protein
MDLPPFLLEFLQALAAGVTVGGAYPLMCVGLGIIFGSMRVINFSSSSLATGPTRSRRPRFRAPATPPSISSHSPSYRV